MVNEIQAGVVTSRSASSSDTLRDICLKQLDQRVAADYHWEVGQTQDRYRDQYLQLVDAGMSVELPLKLKRGCLVVVETRIPFLRQAELLRIPVNPATYLRLKHQPEAAPYSVWCTTVGGLGSAESRKSICLNEMMANLPGTLKPATPLEGIAYPFGSMRGLVLLAFPGGETAGGVYIWGDLPGRLALCLEKYQYTIRVSHTKLDQFDSLVSLLAVHDKKHGL